MKNPEAPWDKTSLSERDRYITYAAGSEELYDHKKDQWECQDPFEYDSLATNAKHEALLAELSRRLEAGFVTSSTTN